MWKVVIEPDGLWPWTRRARIVLRMRDAALNDRLRRAVFGDDDCYVLTSTPVAEFTPRTEMKFSASTERVTRSSLLEEGEVIVMDGVMFEDGRQRIVVSRPSDSGRDS
jgi:hypothetical protein